MQGICFEKTSVYFSVSSAGMDLLQAILIQQMRNAGRRHLLIINRLVSQNIANIVPELRKDLISSQELYMDKTWECCSKRRGKALFKSVKNESVRILLWCNLK